MESRNIENRTENRTMTSRKEKLSQALELLEEAATTNAEEIKQELGKKYQHLRAIITDSLGGDSRTRQKVHDLKNAAYDRIETFKNRVIDRSHRAVETIDRSAHTHPWVYVGSAAFVMTAMGFILGSRFSRK